MTDVQREVMPRASTMERYEAFVAEYATDFDAKRAAIAVGYAAHSAGVTGAKLLTDPKVRTLLRARIQQFAIKHNVTLDRVIMELAACGFSNMGDYIRVDADGLPEIDLSLAKDSKIKMSAVEEVSNVVRTEERDDRTYTTRTVKFKLHDKIGPLNTLAKHLGAFDGHEAPVLQDNRTYNTQVNVNGTAQDAVSAYQRLANANPK